MFSRPSYNAVRMTVIQTCERTGAVFSTLPDLEVLDAQGSKGLQSADHCKSFCLLKTCFQFSAAVTVYHAVL